MLHRTIYSYAIVSVTTLLLTSCATPTGTNEQVAPKNARTVDLVLPQPGTQIVRETKDEEETRTVTYTVLDDVSEYNGVKTFRISDGSDITIYNAQNRNRMATVDGDGKVLYSNEPFFGPFNWPLWEGKEWIQRYKYTDHTVGRSWSNLGNKWEVVKHEEITVPAGTFKTFLLVSKPYVNEARRRKIWYAYEQGIEVKRVSERLSNHYLGPGKTETVVVSITPPE